MAQTIEALQTGLFTYFAHPDLFHYVGSEAIFAGEMRKLCRAAKQTDTPLEINLLGLREGRHYPNSCFWRIAAEEGNSVILGSDAHRPEHVLDAQSEEKAIELANELGLQLIGTLPLRPINT